MFIRARTLEYTFSFVAGNGAEVVVGSVSSDNLSPLFTGVHIGVYAQGYMSNPCLENAYFKYCKWDLVDA